MSAVARSGSRILRALDHVNARHPWDHNLHFHPWILRNLPPAPRHALDVGCGRGELLAALRARCDKVEGIDPDPGMTARSAARLGGDAGAAVRTRTLNDHARRPAAAGNCDVVTMLSSLHHMPLVEALEDARSLLRPGGRLLVVTLVRSGSAADRVWEAANLVANPVMGVLRHPRPVVGLRPTDPIPVRDPEFTLSDLRAAAGRILPGSVIRRREAFRVTLRWTAPGIARPGDPDGTDRH